MALDPNDWARRFRDNADEAERNSLMDSGWSATTARNCTLREAILYRELFQQLREVELKPEDFFDRPQLAAVLAAVYAALPETAKEST